MGKFCTACGRRNEDDSAFCEGCGQALRSAAPPPTGRAASPAPRQWLFRAIVGAVVLVLAVGGIVWWSASPGPSAEGFAAALRSGLGSAIAPSADSLCVANLPYDRRQINADERDVNTRRWMDELVSAGLYTPGQAVPGVFQQLIQYTPTPELDRWRHGARLCVAKSWSVSEVKGGRFNPEKRGQHTVYSASIVWKAEGVAPWLGSMTDIAQRLPGVTLNRGSLTTESRQVFESRNRRWVALSPMDLAQIQRESLQLAQRGVKANTAKADQGGILSALTNLFSGFGTAHPLVGEWAVDSSGLGALVGAAMAFKGDRIIFGDDYIESGGERIKARFDVQGDVVSVRAEGESGAVQFRVKDRNRIAIGDGLTEVSFTRVR